MSRGSGRELNVEERDLAMNSADVSNEIAREILLSFWKVHILHHASEQPVVGQWMLDELRHHGYHVSPGTLYPVLKRMEARGWLRCKVAPPGGKRARRAYRLTARGRKVLHLVRSFVTELEKEVSRGSR